MDKYIVAVKKGTDLQQFYDDMETSGGSETIPDREVSCYDRRPISRNTGYDLTEDEVNNLLNDERVIGVSKQSVIDSLVNKPLWEQTSSDFDKSTSIANTNINWGLYRCIRGSQVSNWGSDGTVDASATIKTTSSGKNVDVLIVDGHLNPDHPEFAVNPDGTGGSRVQQFNWFSLTNAVTGGANGTYTYRSGASLNNANDNHGMHVAGTVAGNTLGWARDANIYYLSPYDGQIANQYLFEYVRAWHNQKEINASTGRRNPTIVNNSWGSYNGIPRDSNTYVTYRGVDSGTNPSDSDLNSRGVRYYTISTIYTGYQDATLVADIEDCVDDGIIFVGAAGNEGEKIDQYGGTDRDNAVMYGGPYYYMRGSWNTAGLRPNSTTRLSVCVGAASALVNDSKTTFSDCGPRVDIFAPGDNIISAVNDGTVNGGSVTTVNDSRNSSYKFAKYDGTSMASPQVCGVLACLLEQYPAMTQSDVFDYIEQHQTTDQMTTTSGGVTDTTDLQGAGNYYLFYFKERPEEGITVPRYTVNARKGTTSGVKYPRSRVKLTKPS